MNLECVCTHTMQCKLHHVPIHSIKFNIAYLCNCSASVKSIGMMTCIKRMKQGGALLRSPRDTERLQTMKSGILQSGMYDAFHVQYTYSILYIHVQAYTTVYILQLIFTLPWYAWALLSSVFNLVYASTYKINMKFMIDQLIHTRYL